MTSLYFKMPKEVVFKDKKFEPLEKEKCWPVEELEKINVLDVNRYKKD